MFEVVLDPARNVDTEPAQELKRPHRPAHREREGDRCGDRSSGGAGVVVVRDEVLRRVDVVDDLRHEEAAAGVLFREQSQMFVVAPAVTFRYRDAPREQLRVGVAAQRLRLGKRRSRLGVPARCSDEHRQNTRRVLPFEPSLKLRARVLGDRAVDDDWAVPTRQVFGEVGRRVEGRHERERALGGVSGCLVGDVVEHQAVHVERAEAIEGGVGDLLGSVARRA